MQTKVFRRRLWREVGRTLLAILLPQACPGCGAWSDELCAVCRAELQARPEPACGRCGQPLLAPGQPCPVDHDRLRGLSLARAPFAYAGTGGRLVRRFKLQGEAAAGEWLARAMARSLRPALQGEFRRAVLVPVPLHRQRRRVRGFDQAAWLAAAVGERLGLPTAAGVLRRVRPTLPQGDPRVRSRRTNVAGAFTVQRPRPIVGRAVVLVDDVCTSGATARTCAAELRAHGATAIALLTACQS